MRQFRDQFGIMHPISWHGAHLLDDGFGNNEWPNVDEAKIMLRGLLQRSETEKLSPRELARIRACDSVININRALMLLKGRDYRTIFGADATCDQVHHQSFEPDTCDCILNAIFDHNKRADAHKTLYPHFPSHQCEGHSKITDAYEHFNTVMQEHRAIVARRG